MAAIAGFSRTIATARKQDQKLYELGTVETVNLIEAGTKLATRALAWGTFYAFLGTGSLVYGIWKLSGANNVSKMCVMNNYQILMANNLIQMDEFRHKMGTILPKVSKGTHSGRTEFDGLNDLMEYLSSDRKKTE